MAADNVEIVRRLIEASRSGLPGATIGLALELCDPRIEFTSRLTVVEGATYRGHDGIRRYFGDISDAMQEWRNEPEEIAEVSDDVVFVSNRFHAVGKDSGVSVELASAAVFVLSGGKVLQLHSYATREEAFRAAGLSSS